MARTYKLKRRAEQAAETRRRIVEAAVDLHGRVGPARTTVSMLAGEAGVQRHTVYAHFPDERSLQMACSALALERDPLPSAEAWSGIRDAAERVRTGLAAVYGWYERNAELAACVLRDAETHTLTQEIVAIRHGPPFGAYRRVLGAGLGPKQRAMLEVALGFSTWKILVREQGLGSEAAAEMMAHAVSKG